MQAIGGFTCTWGRSGCNKWPRPLINHQWRQWQQAPSRHSLIVSAHEIVEIRHINSNECTHSIYVLCDRVNIAALLTLSVGKWRRGEFGDPLQLFRMKRLPEGMKRDEGGWFEYAGSLNRLIASARYSDALSMLDALYCITNIFKSQSRCVMWISLNSHIWFESKLVQTHYYNINISHYAYIVLGKVWAGKRVRITCCSTRLQTILIMYAL